MSRVFANLAVFTLGLIVACVFAMRGRLLTLADSVAHKNSVEIEKLAMPSTLDTQSGKLAYARERRGVIRQLANDGNRLSVLTRALDDGSIESLELLRAEYLKLMPDYERQLLPKLKRAGLEALFRRFTDRDWKEWPSLASDPTAARNFVNDVTLVNSDIGNFLETSAHLLHGMYVSIASGEVYKLDDDLYYLTQNAAEILKGRTLNLGTPEDIFDVSFVKDPTVALTFERIKTELTKQFIVAQPDELAAQLRLLAVLDPRAIDRTSAHALAKILRTLTLRASVQFRADVFPDIVGSQSLVQWAKLDPVVAQPLAELYLVGALDALEVGRTGLAKKLLDRSDETFPGLKSRQSVVAYFNSVSDKGKAKPAAGDATVADVTRSLPVAEGDSAAPSKAAVSDAPAKSGETVPGSGWFGLIKWMLLLGFVAAGVRAFMIYLARQQEFDYQANLPAPADLTPAETHTRITDPGAVSFEMDEDTSDIDLGFDQEIANR